MVDRISLDFPARTEYLSLVRAVISAVAAVGSDLPSGRLEDVRLAATEACANAIDAERRRPGGPVAFIELRCWVEPTSLAIEVHDSAGGFDVGSLVPPPPVTRPDRLHFERGLGIPLMRELTDELEFRDERGGTTVRLVLAMDRPGPPEGG